MKDLYQAIKVPPDASAENIEKRIAKTSDQEDSKNAEYVLLNPERKRVYDRHHAELTKIGKIRHELGLSEAEHWDVPPFEDFKVEDTFSSIAMAKIKSIITSPYRTTFVMIVLLGIIVMLVMLILSDIAARSNVNVNGLMNGDDKQVPAAVEENNKEFKTGVVKEDLSSMGVSKVTIRYFDKQKRKCYFKLTNEQTGKTIIEASVLPGNKITCDIPQGSYQLYFALGKEWHGRDKLFGPDTTYHKIRYELKDEQAIVLNPDLQWVKPIASYEF